MSASQRDGQIAAPKGFRWATGGGSPFGGCNGLHLARGGVVGTLCGKVGPTTPPDQPCGARLCGTCARIAKVPKIIGGDCG